jgi:diacylglycerol kinase family enzyme
MQRENATRRSALVLINRRSGTVRSRGHEAVAMLVREALENSYFPLTIELFEGDVGDRLKAAVAKNEVDVIIAGGGDGTIANAAGHLIGTPIILGVLPLGTMNLIVQALGFSPRLEEALAQMRSTERQMIDVGTANGRVFLHQVSFGLQPRMAKIRERLGYRSRAGKMFGAARALLLLAMRPKLVRVNVEIENETLRVSAPLLAITNNPIGSATNWSIQHRLDRGILGYYALNEFSLRAVVRLARGYLRNRLHDDEIVENRVTKALTIKRRPRRIGGRLTLYKKRKGILASMDGEVTLLDNPVAVQILPKSLAVLTFDNRRG